MQYNYKQNDALGLLEPTLYYAGIETGTFNYFAARQNSTNWCWAACIQMIFKYYGFNVNQEEFAYHNCGLDSSGNIKNCPGSIEMITQSLNYCTQKYCLSTSVNSGAPDINYLANLLKENMPIIVGYGKGRKVGHAVLITGMTWEVPIFGEGELKSIIVRDPWPTHHNRVNPGRIEYTNPWVFLNDVYAWWLPTLTAH